MMLDWDIHKWETEFAFDSLAEYLDMIEGQYKNVRELEGNRISKNPPAGLSEEEYAEWQSEVQFLEARYEKDFPSKIRYSFVILLYIVFETRLRAACDEISKRRSLELRESDLKGASIERAKAFLKKVAKLPSGDQMIWQWLSDFQKVRDCIVHTNGRIEESRDKDRLNHLCNENVGLSSEAGSLMIERHYCTKMLEIAKSYFRHLFDSAGFGKSLPVNQSFQS
jgi:hypothetical protein